LVFVASAGSANISFADEGGVSFWLPGLFGSLAAAQQVPGLAVRRDQLLHKCQRIRGNSGIARNNNRQT
jgi:hypothetical protein